MLKEKLKEDYCTACNNYLYKLLENWGFDSDDVNNCGFWVSDEPGGMYCLHDEIFINMDEIIYCVDNDIKYNTYLEYDQYCQKCHEYNFNIINLKSFVSGAPIVSDEQFKLLDNLKEGLNNEIGLIKSKF